MKLPLLTIVLLIVHVLVDYHFQTQRMQNRERKKEFHASNRKRGALLFVWCFIPTFLYIVFQKSTQVFISNFSPQDLQVTRSLPLPFGTLRYVPHFGQACTLKSIAFSTASRLKPTMTSSPMTKVGTPLAPSFWSSCDAAGSTDVFLSMNGMCSLCRYAFAVWQCGHVELVYTVTCFMICFFLMCF